MYIKINDLLNYQNKTKYWLAQETNISYQSIHKLCSNDSSSIKFEMIEKICKALNCTPNDIFDISN
ncbi:MAG: helix-turn-helix transcriptional regulator [Candidatus Galacturonibacter soehngenii]|nr:helix-turn-helix transcriptional regulator [Candidatus Galacturonibacter soehngenii]